MAAVTICSDFGTPQNKVSHCFHYFPIYLPWSDGTGCCDLVFWMLSFKPTFSLSSFIFIKRLFSSLLAKLCLILCDLMDCSTWGFPVHHYLPEFAQTHVHCIGDAIQPSHPVTLFSSCPQSFPASGSFPMSGLFTSGGQSIRASAAVLPMNIQGWRKVKNGYLWDSPHNMPGIIQGQCSLCT